MTLEKIKQHNGRNNPRTLENAARLMREVVPNIDERTIGTLSARMAHVANPDCMALLMLASRGFVSTLDSPKVMGMDKKRYYIALEKLKGDGLIAKQEGVVYTLTVLGMIEVARLTTALEDTAADKKLDFLADILKVRAFDGDVRKVLKFLDGSSGVEALTRK